MSHLFITAQTALVVLSAVAVASFVRRAWKRGLPTTRLGLLFALERGGAADSYSRRPGVRR